MQHLKGDCLQVMLYDDLFGEYIKFIIVKQRGAWAQNSGEIRAAFVTVTQGS